MAGKKLRSLTVAEVLAASRDKPVSVASFPSRLNVRLMPYHLSQLRCLLGRDRSEYIRGAIEDKLKRNPDYQKRPQTNGGEYISLRLSPQLLVALQMIPERDRSEFIRQAVEERIDLM